MPSVVLVLVLAGGLSTLSLSTPLHAQRTPSEQLAHARRLLEIPIRRIEADRAFRQAFERAERLHDTTVMVEAAHELGEIRRRRWLTGRDRRLYTSNIVFDPLTAARRLHYTREFLEQHSRPIADAGTIDRLEAEKWFRRALALRPAQITALVPLLDLLAEERRYDEMRALATAVLAVVDTSPALRMTAGFAAVRLGRVDEADAHFTRAMALYDPATREELLDIGRLLRAGDSVRVAGLGDAASQGTIAAFWEAADPLLDTTPNEARLEYLARMAYADLRFRDGATAPPGWRTDRGTIVVRYGIPPVVATFSPMSDADARDAIGRIITVWFYPEREVDFVFTGPPAFNVANFAGNYRDEADARREAAPFLLDDVAAARGIDSLATQIARFRGERDRALDLVVATSLPVPALYQDMAIDRSDLQLSVRVGAAGALRLAARDTLSIALPTSASATRFWTLPLAMDTLGHGDGARGGSAIRVRIEARDPALTAATARAQLEVPPLPSPSGAALSDVLVVDRPRDSGAPLGGAAASGTGTRWPARGLRPRGSLQLAPGDTIGIYWEMYQLATNPEQRVQYDVELRITLLELDRGRNPVRRTLGGLADLVGLSPEGDQQVALRFRRDEPAPGMRGPRMPIERVTDLVTIGLGSAPAGRYRLDLVITDRVGGTTLQTSRTLQVTG